MKFRTEIPIKKPRVQFGYSDALIFMGSCFSVHIHNKLSALKFNTLSNPFGIVYNPISLARQLMRVVENKVYTEGDLHYANERWFSFDHHSDYSFSSKKECLTAINHSLSGAHSQLKKAEILFLTLGTSWVYRAHEDNKVVSNCHKLPSKTFVKYLANTTDMVTELEKAIYRVKDINPNICVVFSISPVRHLADGFFENQLSKGRLFDVIDQLRNNLNIGYFPAYEMMMDDLRDYRFYAADLIHPSDMAITYIWKRFVETFVVQNSLSTLVLVEKVLQAANHRPFNPKSEGHQKFVENTLSKIALLEKDVFGSFDREREQLIQVFEQF